MHPAASHRPLIFSVIILLVTGLSGCSSYEATTDGSSADPVADSGSEEESGFNLATYRNSLSDLHSTQQHDVPPLFMEPYEEDGADNRDPNHGYRIQIVSTRNVSLADSVDKSFRAWADTTLAGFNPETYVSFRQPHYKVHVGDFSERERAIKFSRLVKRKYPDAWVVHDQINPYFVPPDTVEIGLKSEITKENVPDSTDSVQ